MIIIEQLFCHNILHSIDLEPMYAHETQDVVANTTHYIVYTVY